MVNQRTEVRCSACHAVVVHTAQHCRLCGESFGEPSCPNPECGAKHLPGDLFCDKCGSPLPEETPHAHKVTVQVEEPYRLRGLAIALYCAISICGGASVWQIWSLFARIDVFSTYESTFDGSKYWADAQTHRFLTDLALADSLVTTAQAWFVLTCLIVFVILITWLWRATKNLKPRSAVKWGPGWAIGGWFTPFGALFIPYQVVRDAWLLKRAPDGSLPTQSLRIWLPTWIAGLIAMTAIADAPLISPTLPRNVLAWTNSEWIQLRAADLVGALGAALFVVCLVGLAFTVRRISARHDSLEMQI